VIRPKTGAPFFHCSVVLLSHLDQFGPDDGRRTVPDESRDSIDFGLRIRSDILIEDRQGLNARAGKKQRPSRSILDHVAEHLAD
jgi:hypothetical protein